MKINSTQSFLKKSSVYFGLAFVTGLATSCSVTENVNAIETKKPGASKKEREVKIYPDMIKKVIHIKSMKSTEVDFFVFDTEGTIMVHYKMNGGDHKKINGLNKGIYTYQVFKKDEMSESGKIVIK